MAQNTISILIKAQDQASSTVSRSAANVEKASQQIKAAAKVAALATAATAVAIGTHAVQSAGKYESSLSKLRQASGATADEMKKLSAMSMQLGKDNSLAGVSAADAAATMTELAKAGLSVKDTLAASKGTMSLAKAGNIEFADAAVIAASALNAFSMRGDQANEVADTLAAGANASQAELSDLALGLQQSATVAKQFKLSLNDNVTALSLFANNGIKGSDAGTSLKTMLIALAKPSKQSAKAMAEIGFEAYDAEGKFVGLREMSTRLSKSLSGLTDEQKQATLATIFGTDAFRAAAVLSDNAGDSYDKMSKSVGKAGAAQAAAKAQMGSYERAIENLKNTADDLSIRLGYKLLPAVTTLVNFVSGSATPVFNTLGGTISGQIPVLSGLALATVSYGAVVGGVSLATKGWAASQALLNIAMTANPVGLVVAATAGIVGAYVMATQQTRTTADATVRLRDARNQLRAATDAARQSELNLKNEHLSAQGATLSVERAQRTYNEAVRQFGPKSLEAREAAYSLTSAQNQLRDANSRVAAATEANKQKQQELANKKTAVKQAEAEKRNSINSTSQAVLGQTSALHSLGLSLDQINGKTVTYNVVGKVDNKEAAVAAGYKSGGPFKHATGTSYAPGGMTWVGENGPELMRVPQGSQVFPNYQSRNMAAQGGGGDTIITISGSINIETPQAANAFWDRIDKTQRLAKVGMA